MKLVIFLFCALAFLLLLTPTSSLQLNPHYSSPSQGLNEKIVIKIKASRKLMNIPSEHVMGTTVYYEDSSEQSRVTSYGTFKEEENRLNEEEEKKALSKYLSMDYPRFRRRRPVHNKSLPLRP